MKVILKERMGWIDLCKGLGMLLVMLGHAPFPGELTKVIYTFHMPLFFFLSGYLFSFRKHSSFVAFLKRKLITLVIPYFSLSLINYFYWVFVYRNIGNDFYSNSGISLYRPLWGTLLAQRDTPFTIHNLALWFLPCLFFAELLFYFIVKYSDNYKQIIVYLMFCSIIGYSYSTYMTKALPWSIDAALTAVVFLGAGYIIKNKMQARYFTIHFFIIYLGINLFFGLHNKTVNMFQNMYGNYIFFYISAFGGIFAFITFVRILEPVLKRVTIFAFIGVNSLIYLAFHKYIVFPLIGQLLNHLSFYQVQSESTKFLEGISYTIVGSLMLVPVIFFINRYTPFILGKRN
ncbi:MAG: acyltransferase family protein [Gorillibacterium sp.]|nr:acyltransferase family protein [Gorillibacterium sp.]